MVKFGMMWSDPYVNKNRTLSTAIGDGISGFIKRFHHPPTHVDLPQPWYDSLTEMELEKISKDNGVLVNSSQNVLLGSMFIGYPEVPEWWNR